MFGTESLRNHAREWSFVEISMTEPDGKSLDWTRTGAGHQSDYHRRISATTEHRAERHIGDQPDAYRFRQPMLQLFQTCLFAGGRISSVFREIPILTNFNFSRFKFQHVAGRQFLNRRKSCRWIGNVSEIKILEKSVGVQFRQLRRGSKNGFDFRTE